MDYCFKVFPCFVVRNFTFGMSHFLLASDMFLFFLCETFSFCVRLFLSPCHETFSFHVTLFFFSMSYFLSVLDFFFGVKLLFYLSDFSFRVRSFFSPRDINFPREAFLVRMFPLNIFLPKVNISGQPYKKDLASYVDCV